MAYFEKGSYVFLPDEERCFVPAKVTSSFEKGKAGQAVLIDDEGNEVRSVRVTNRMSALTMSMDKQSLRRWSDMVVLKQLDNAALLHNIRLRYKRDEIYTCIGSILISVNPYKIIPDLYGPVMTERFIKAGSGLKDMDPHIYGIAEHAYSSMINDDTDQSCVITGESGAGKTEATKLFMAYIAERSRRQKAPGDAATDKPRLDDDDEFDVPLREQILGANPVMEAFGNAKTVRNNNSSRFGKLIDVGFQRSLGSVHGGRITNYLLEKSRVVRHLEGERSYHIFYQLCAAATTQDAEMQRKYSLMDANEFYYLNQSSRPSTVIEDVDDAATWHETIEAMKLLHMDHAQLDGVAQVLAAILHLGNVTFDVENSRSDFAIVTNTDSLKKAAELFGMTSEELERGLLTRDISNAKERVIQKHNVREATDSRDALAKHTYSRLFNWLTGCINDALTSRGTASQDDIRTISVLDIFGFESFGHNSFEQLCINYCNEKLQGFFNDHIFKLEQEEYRREEIDVSQIGFSDNQGVINAIDHRSDGIFAICDDQVNLLRGSDEGFLHKMQEVAKKMEQAAAAHSASRDNGFDIRGSGHGGRKGSVVKDNMAHLARKSPLQANKQIIKKPDVKETRRNPASRNAFIIVHFAGEVTYNVEGFLEKNRDVLRDDLLQAIENSSFDMMVQLFQVEDMPTSKKKNIHRKTLGRKFQDQLDKLMVRLNVTEPHFVRTIKPNSVKKPNIFEAPLVLDQLRYAGLLEVCRIRQMGYPIRKMFDEFFHMYRCIRPDAVDVHDLIDKLREDGVLFGTEWQKGKTKVFMRAVQFDKLATFREEALWGVTVAIQTQVRRFLARNRYLRTKTAFDDLERGIKNRDRNLLEKTIPFAASLPNAGRNVSVIERARRVLAEIKQEDEHLAAMEVAVESRDMDALPSLVETAERLGLSDRAIVKEAKKIIARHREEKRAVQALQNAIAARDMDQLVEALDNADKLNLGNINEVQTARALLSRLEEEGRLLSELESALDRRDVKEMETLCQALVDLGLGDHATVVEAMRITKKIAQESKARKEALEKLERDAEEAIEKRDLDLLNALRIRIAELGATGALFDEAMQLRDELEKREMTLHKIQVEMGLLAAKARSLDGIVESDLQPLESTLETASELHFTEKNEPVVKEAKDFLERMREQLEVQRQLVDALDENTYSALVAALMAAQRLGMETENARKVAEEVRHLEKIKLALDRIDNRKLREKRATTLRYATPEEREALDKERLDEMDSPDYNALLIEAESNNGQRYLLANFYRIRADEDYVESFPPGERNKQANMKLFSSRSPIPKSLTELDEDQEVIAIRCNHALLQYCGDVGATNTTGLAQFVINRALEDPRVADEVLLQVVKHLRGNVLPQSERNAWLLLCALTKYVAPSEAFAPYFLNFLLEHRTKPSLIGNFARLCLAQVGSSMALPPCPYKPSLDELAHYKRRPPVLLSVSVVDGSILNLPCSPDQRVEHMHKLVRHKTGILDAVSRPAFSLFIKDTSQSQNDTLRDRLVRFFKFYNTKKLEAVEVFVSYWRNREEELFEKLVEKYGPEPDLLGSEEIESPDDDESRKNGLLLPITAARRATKMMRVNNVPKKNGPPPQAAWPLPFWTFPGNVVQNLAKQGREPQFSFKRRFVPRQGRADILLYNQVKQDVESGLLTITSESDITEMAAIATLLEEENENLSLEDPDELIDAGFQRHIPRAALEQKSLDHFARDACLNVRVGSEGNAQLRDRYVEIASNAPAFGMSLFYCQREDTDSSRLYVVGIDQNGVHILNSERSDVIRSFPLSAISKFGAATGTLWLKVKKSALKKQGQRLSARFAGLKKADLKKTNIKTETTMTNGSKFAFLNRKDGIDIVLNTLQAWEMMDVLFDLKRILTVKQRAEKQPTPAPTPIKIK